MLLSSLCFYIFSHIFMTTSLTDRQQGSTDSRASCESINPLARKVAQVRARARAHSRASAKTSARSAGARVARSLADVCVYRFGGGAYAAGVQSSAVSAPIALGLRRGAKCGPDSEKQLARFRLTLVGSLFPFWTENLDRTENGTFSFLPFQSALRQETNAHPHGRSRCCW